MIASVKEEREKEREERGRRGGHLHSPPSVKEKSSCGMNTFVYSFGPSIFSPVGLWLLERRCRLAPSQKESIFLPLLHFSLSASFSLIQYFLQNTTLPFHAQARNAGRHLRETKHTHTHTHTHRQKCEVTERSASSDPGKTPAQDVSHFPALLIAVIHRCSVSLTDASLSLSVHGSSGALETVCGLFTTLMFANDF